MPEINPEQREAREKLLAIKQMRAERLKDDPLNEYKPFKKQQEFSDAIIKRRVNKVFAFCGNRAGKSDVGAYVGAKLARFGHEDPATIYNGSGSEFIMVKDRATSGWVVSLDNKVSTTVIEPKYFDNGNVPPGQLHDPFIPKREISHWHTRDKILKLKNGSIVEYRSCEAGAGKFQGSGRDWIHFDEEPPKAVYDEAIMRVEAGRKLQVFVTATLLPPLGMKGGVSWLFPEVIEPWQEGKAKGYEIFNWATLDNPYLGEDEVNELIAQYPLNTDIGRIRILGELIPGLGGSRAYHNFDRRIHIRECTVNPRLPLAWFWDFNVEPMVSGFGQIEDDTFKINKEFFMETGSVPDMVEKAYEYLTNHMGEIYLYGDATGRGRTSQHGKSDYDVLFETLRFHHIDVRMKVPEKNPFVTDRLNAVNLVLKGPDGSNYLQVDPSCTELIRDFQDVLLDRDGGIKKVSDLTNPYSQRTHISDGCGYWIAYERPVRRNYGTKQRRVSVKRPGYGITRRS